MFVLMNYSSSLYLVIINANISSEKSICEGPSLYLSIYILGRIFKIFGLFSLFTKNAVSQQNCPLNVSRGILLEYSIANLILCFLRSCVGRFLTLVFHRLDKVN